MLKWIYENNSYLLQGKKNIFDVDKKRRGYKIIQYKTQPPEGNY